MLLRGKNAVIYGGSGAIGGAVARGFAAEGARVFLVARSRPRLEAVADEVAAGGGRADIATLDAFDADAVQRHADEIAETAGSIDISFNLVDLGDTHGAPLTEMPPERFVLPVANAMRTHFLTATAAARHMMRRRSGVILALTAQAARKPYPQSGGFGVAGAAIEGLCRQLAAELGPYGIRTVCLRSAGSPDAPGVQAAIDAHRRSSGLSPEAFDATIGAATLLKRLPLLAEIANAAVLMASDRASAITGAIANATCGEIVD